MLRGIGNAVPITMMSQENELDQWKSQQFHNFDHIMRKSRFVPLVVNVQSRGIWETPVNQSFQYSNM